MSAVFVGDREVGSASAVVVPSSTTLPADWAKALTQPAMTPPPDFWDRVAREVARLMVERQGGAVPPITYPPVTAADAGKVYVGGDAFTATSMLGGGA